MPCVDFFKPPLPPCGCNGVDNTLDPPPLPERGLHHTVVQPNNCALCRLAYFSFVRSKWKGYLGNTTCLGGIHHSLPQSNVNSPVSLMLGREIKGQKVLLPRHLQGKVDMNRIFDILKYSFDVKSRYKCDTNKPIY